MEDTLRVSKGAYKNVATCLNPCFNGRYSQRALLTNYVEDFTFSLNPCFNGRYSQRVKGVNILPKDKS